MCKYAIMVSLLAALMVNVFISMPLVKAAGAMIPSQAELQFAKQFYDIYISVENSDKVLVKQLEGTDLKSMSGLTTFLVKKYNYTKNAYDKLNLLRPPANFVTSYNLLKEAMNEHMVYLKDGLELMKTNPQGAASPAHTSRFTAIKVKYSKSMEDFLIVVNGWQPDYVKRVLDK